MGALCPTCLLFRPCGLELDTNGMHDIDSLHMLCCKQCIGLHSVTNTKAQC